MRFEKNKSSTRVSKEAHGVSKQVEKSPEEGLEETIFEGEGLTVHSDEDGEIIYPKEGGALEFIPDAHSWYTHFTPFGQADNAPELRSAILVVLYEDINDLLRKIDRESIKEPDFIQGSTNPEMANLVESFGFETTGLNIDREDLNNLTESDVDDALSSGVERKFLGDFLELSRSFVKGEINSEEGALSEFLNIWNNLNSDARRSVSKLMTILTREDDHRGELLRAWIDEKISDLDEEEQDQVREMVVQAAGIVGDTDTKRVVGEVEDIRRAIEEFESRTLSSGDKFVDQLRERAEQNKPINETEWPI